MAASHAPPVIRAAELQGMRLKTVAGRPLGRLFDLRVRSRAGVQAGEALVVELVFGRRGWLERIGVREVSRDSLPWSAVRQIDGDVIWVEELGQTLRP